MKTEIDLHGVKHEEVTSMVDSFIWEHMQKGTNGVTIITGNSPEMKRMVNDIASEYGFKASEGMWNTGMIYLTLK